MISATCDCGKSVRVDVQFAGRTIRCPACFGALAIPTRDDNSFSEGLDETDLADERPRRSRVVTLKRIAGGVIVLIGSLLALGTIIGVLAGRVKVRQLQGLMIFYALIFGLGVSWLKGET